MAESIMEFQNIQELTFRSIDIVSTSFRKVPGSAIFVGYVHSRYHTDPLFFAIELMLVLFSIHYLCAKSYSSKSKQNNVVALTEDEIDELVEDWTPEPLVASLTPLEKKISEKLPVIVGPTGPKCKLDNGRTVINLATCNFYNFAGNEVIKQNAINALRKYGVGPCSAPGFYGTQDMHIETEAKVASFLGTESCLIYAHAFSTMSSIISAFAKRGDIIVADIACNYPIRKGLQISRSKIYWYQHNDLEDLERVLKKVVKESKVLTRRFIVTEGLFETVGDMIDLPKIVELKQKYKFRLILDETWSIGVLGRTGRGITEAQNVDISHVDILGGSLAGPLAAGGGFCASSREVVEHQRINSPAFCYSCALPAMLATTAGETISMLQTNPEILTASRNLVTSLRAQLSKSEWIISTSSPLNPMQILVLQPDFVSSRKLSIADQEQILQDCVDELLTRNIMITRLKSMPPVLNSSPREQGWQLQPALKVCITTGLSEREISKAGLTIRQAISKVMEKAK